MPYIIHTLSLATAITLSASHSDVWGFSKLGRIQPLVCHASYEFRGLSDPTSMADRESLSLRGLDIIIDFGHFIFSLLNEAILFLMSSLHHPEKMRT